MTTRLNRRRFLGSAIGLAAGVGAMGLGGCVADPGTTTPNASGGPASLGTAQLRMAWWGGDARHERTRKVLELFTAKYPDITTTPEFGGFQGYYEKLATQTSGGNAPDVFQLLQEYVPDYGGRNQLLDLEPYLGNLLNLADFDESSVETGRIDGRLVAVSFGDNTPAIVYNATALEGYGLKAPEPDWTWDDLASVAQQVSAKSGGKVFGTTNLGGTSYLAEIWMRQRGKEMYSTEGGLGFEQQDLVDWFTYWQELRKADLVVPPEVQALATGNLADEPLVKGLAVMFGNYPNQLTNIGPLLPKSTLNLLPIPNAADQQRPGQYLKPVNWLSVYARGKNPEEAVALIDFIANDVEAGKILGTDRGVAPSTAVREAITPGLSAEEKRVVDYLALAGQNVTPLEVPIPTGGGEVYTALRVLSDDISFEKVSITEGVDRFFTQAERALR